jgi:hypothetical protein
MTVSEKARAAAHEATACSLGEPGWTEMLAKSRHDLIDIALDAAEPGIRADERERLGHREAVAASVSGELDDAFQFTDNDGSRHSYVTRAWVEALLAKYAASAAAAERERLLSELRIQFDAPRGADTSFLDGWRTAVSEFRAIIIDPDHQLAPLADMITKLRAGRPAETPREWYEDGRVAERERIRWLAIVKRAVYCKACDGAPCDYSDELAPFIDLIPEDTPDA